MWNSVSCTSIYGISLLISQLNVAQTSVKTMENRKTCKKVDNNAITYRKVSMKKSHKLEMIPVFFLLFSGFPDFQENCEWIFFSSFLYVNIKTRSAYSNVLNRHHKQECCKLLKRSLHFNILILSFSLSGFLHVSGICLTRCPSGYYIS